MNLDLRSVSLVLRKQAKAAFESGGILGLFTLVGHEQRANLLEDNFRLLLDRGLYEEALIITYTHGPSLTPMEWRKFFGLADVIKLRGFGAPIPDGRFLVYRGIADTGHRKFIRGLSWTKNPGIAAWFATRKARVGFNPVVYSMEITLQEVLFATDERSEEEIVVAAWYMQKIKKLKILPEPYRAVDGS
jgi:hypothetical protein